LTDAHLLVPDAPLAEGRETIRAIFADLEATPDTPSPGDRPPPKSPDGTWKVAVDMFNTGGPPATDKG
jgi:ketosteroid isomerase-like protein